jgi:hypothetical protein
MRFKVDENLHSDFADLLRQHGHDALTVYEQVMTIAGKPRQPSERRLHRHATWDADLRSLSTPALRSRRRSRS